MRRTCLLIGSFLALGLPAGPAVAALDDPYVIYTANSYVSGAVVLRADPATGSLVEISRNGKQGTRFVHPYDIAVDRDGSLLVVDMGGFAESQQPDIADGAVLRVDPLTGDQSVVSEGGSLIDPAGLVVAPNGTIYVVDNVGVAGKRAVVRIDPLSGAQTIVTEGGQLCNPFGIAREADGNLLVANYGDFAGVNCVRSGGSVIRINSTTGGQAEVTRDGLFAQPFGLAVEPGGRILVVNETSPAAGVSAVDPVSGAQTAITSNSPSDTLRLPARIAVAPNGKLLVTDFELEDGRGGIVEVEPRDGSQRLVHGGPPFYRPLGIAVAVNRAPAAVLTAMPGSVAGDSTVSFDASGSSDPEGLRLLYEWDLDGDGSFESAGWTPTTARSFRGNATFTPRVRVSDPHGGSAVAAAVLTVDATAPVLSDFDASADALLGRPAPRRARRLPRSGPRARRAVAFRYRLSEPARVAITLARALPGRRVRRDCRRAGSRRVGRRARCTRWRSATTLLEQGASGANARRFSGRVDGRRLRAGRYVAVAVAEDAVGNRSAARRVGLRVVAASRG
jgi:DNA-binding beta-propeller fold protein YncE